MRRIDNLGAALAAFFIAGVLFLLCAALSGCANIRVQLPNGTEVSTTTFWSSGETLKRLLVTSRTNGTSTISFTGLQQESESPMGTNSAEWIGTAVGTAGKVMTGR